jgi:hypothetical protein
MTMGELGLTCLGMSMRPMTAVHGPPSGALLDTLGGGSSARKWCTFVKLPNLRHELRSPFDAS